MTQIEESLKPEINKNNEKIDNSATILNKNNEILNDNSKSLSSFCSSIETIKNLISELPQKTTIGDEFLSVNYFLTRLNSIVAKKADQDTIQSKFELQTNQINKIREEFKTEYKQLLDTEIKNLNEQLKEQKTENENYRQILDKQTDEYERDKQRLEQHKVTIEENKRLIESQKKEIKDCLKRAEDAVCKQSILQSKLDDQTKRYKEELKTKEDELKKETKRQKEELNMVILNLEDKLKSHSAIADKAKGNINSKEEFIRELIQDKDNQKKDFKDLNKKLDDDAKVIKNLEKKLNKLRENNRVLEERIK